MSNFDDIDYQLAQVKVEMDKVAAEINNVGEALAHRASGFITEATRKADELTAGLRFWVTLKYVQQWGDDKNITNPENTKPQLLKVVEELGELAGDVSKGRDPTDSLGDVLVTLILSAKCLGISFDTALEHAWNVIKDRTGKTVDGVFVKDE